MPAHLIGPLPQSTPAGLVTSRSQRALPPDILREASLRLGIFSFIVGVLWTLGTVLGHVSARSLMPAGDTRWMQFSATDAIAVGAVALSIALFLYTRRTTRNPQFVLDLGLAYMVVMAAALGLMWHWDPAPKDYPVYTQISWIGVMLLMFAAILPTSTPKMFIAGSIAVAMNPIGMLIAHSRDLSGLPSVGVAVLMHYPDFLLLPVAIVISRVVTQLGRQVTKARELGSYQLGDLLGRGGMGEVYKATHRMLARPAAIKLIRPEALGGQDDEAAQLAVKRFYREAESAANLRSPHTVEIYDFGVTEDGTLYFVMELLEGMDLESLVRKHGPLPASRVIHILDQVCESLEEAHRAGLVHRDIKPANIHVGRLGLRQDFVKVLDFGLVKPFTAKNVEHSLATVAGQTPGTPAYMAPEMALGDAVDGRADIYALGCVAYYLLTAQLVFEADTTFQMIARHLQNEPSHPSLRTENHIPRALDKLVLACLEKEPRERPQSAEELARALRSIDVLAWGNEEAIRWWSAHAPALLSS
ncbi:MAG: serine/threonine protein kinase [Gemmatimonadota bacterium]|nr:serine/threonine protein kinase [Gemmatimonadota bacterium]